METEELKELFCRFCNRKFLDETAFQFHEKWSHYAIRKTQYYAYEDLNSEFESKTSKVQLKQENENISTEAEEKEGTHFKIKDEEVESEIMKSQFSLNQLSESSLWNGKSQKSENELDGEQVSTIKTYYLPQPTLNKEELIGTNRSNDEDATDHNIFNCNFCERSFSRKSNLKRHIYALHEQQGRYQCNCCPKNYGTIACLKSHIKYSHEKLSSHKCTICQKSYARKMSLKRHIKTVHDRIKSFRCQFCEKCFYQRPHLKTHIEKIHKQSLGIHSK
jgi:uncharacterized Zn-finger protein